MITLAVLMMCLTCGLFIGLHHPGTRWELDLYAFIVGFAMTGAALITFYLFNS